MKWVPIKEKLPDEKAIDRNAVKIALACMPLPALYVEVGAVAE